MSCLPKCLFFFVLYILLFPHHLNGQDLSWKKRLYIESIVHYGFVSPHHDFLAYFIDEHVKGYELKIGLHTSGKELWEQKHNYPNIGIGFYHSGLGNPIVFGKINALYYFAERFYLNQNCRFNIGSRLSIGPAYVTKKHDFTEDNYDMAIGSNINIYFNISIEGICNITPKISAKTGIGLTHTSNGNYHQPNTGLNLITAFAGLQYSFNAPKVRVTENYYSNISEPPSNQWIITGGAGIKQVSLEYEKYYTPVFLTAEYERRLSYSFWLGGALSYYHDNSITKESELFGDSSAITKTNFRVSAHLSAEISMGKLSFVLQPGIYLINPYHNTKFMNNQIGCRYALSSRILASVMIKAHWIAIADFLEWGFCYRWHK